MDDLATINSNSSSNSNSSITSGSTTTIATNASQQQAQNGLSYYEAALKKLNHILKSKASDVGKQLEDLWDSINQLSNNTTSTTSITNGQQQKGVPVVKPAVGGGGVGAVVNGKSVNVVSGRVTSSSETHAQEGSNTLKRDASKLSTNTLTASASSESLAKKTKTQASSSTIATKPLVASSKSTTVTSSSSSSATKPQSAASKTNTTTSQKTLGKSGAPFTSNSKKPSSPNVDTIDDAHSSSSSSSTISNSSSRAAKIPSPPLVTNSNGTIDSNAKGSTTHVGFNLLTEGDVVDMLEFSCCICNQFNQELNNKLIECKKCTKLYHQSCHVPHIENKDIEAASNGDRLAECSLCKSALKSPPLAAKMVAASQQKIYPFEEECTRMEASSNENKISINFNSKITNNNNSNNLIEISNIKVSNSLGVVQENTNISNNLNSTNSIPESESNNSNSNTNANTNNTSNLNGNTAKFFKRELPKIESKESPKPSTNSNSSHIETSLTKSESVQDISQPAHPTTTINNNSISSNNSAPKGFAALANKFNSNGGSASIKTPSSSSNSSLPTSNGKVNHDDLFKKFRQSVNTNSSSSSSSTNLNKVFTNTEKTPQQSTPASSLINKPVINNSTSNNIIQQKRNIFNTPNNLTNANDTVKKSNLVNTVKL